MSKTLNMFCTIQEANGDDLLTVIATESLLGLDLHATEEEPAPDYGEPPHETYWGRLSLDGWATLAEMFLLRHPERARKLVEKWQALRDAVPLRAKPYYTAYGGWYGLPIDAEPNNAEYTYGAWKPCGHSLDDAVAAFLEFQQQAFDFCGIQGELAS